MLEANLILIKYYKEFVKEPWTMWFLLYEFDISKSDIVKLSQEEIIKKIIGTKVLNESLHQPEINVNERLLAYIDREDTLGRPFIWENIKPTDFKYYKSLKEFDNWVKKFRVEGWEDDREDAQVHIDETYEEIISRTNFKNGVWHLCMEELPEEKLTGIHWVYMHYHTFIEINKQTKTIRTFDFGYD